MKNKYIPLVLVVPQDIKILRLWDYIVQRCSHLAWSAHYQGHFWCRSGHTTYTPLLLILFPLILFWVTGSPAPGFGQECM